MVTQGYDFWIIYAGQKRCGYVRVSPDGTVSIAIDRNYHNRGVATSTLKQLPRRPMTAQIRVGNKPSISAFRAAGFRTNFVIMEKEIRP
jgi:hypothetical protein